MKNIQIAQNNQGTLGNMFIKTLSVRETPTFYDQGKPGISTKSKRNKPVQDVIYHEDRLFTDDVWFQKPSVMPHVENHRPIIKRRIIKLKQEALNPNIQEFTRHIRHPTADCRPARKNYTTINPKTERKPEKQIQRGSNKHQTSCKETFLLRKQPEIPDYVRNIMKPCRIGAMKIEQRPNTARKGSIQYRSLLSRKATERNNMRKDNPWGLQEDFRRLLDKNTSIEPWGQLEDEQNFFQ